MANLPGFYLQEDVLASKDPTVVHTAYSRDAGQKISSHKYGQNVFNRAYSIKKKSRLMFQQMYIHFGEYEKSLHRNTKEMFEVIKKRLH